MKLHGGERHTDPHYSFWLRKDTRKRKLTCLEYLPFIALGILLVSLFAQVLVPQVIR